VTGSAWVLLFLVFLVCWEVIAPRRALTTSRLLRWSSNIAVGCLNTALTQFPLAPLGVAVAVAEHQWGLLNNIELPAVFSVGATVVLIDLLHYGEHRVLHAVPILWRVHRVHHVDRDLDYTTSFRFHPIEALIENTMYLGAVAVFGLPAAGVLAYGVIATAITLVTHSNIRLPLGLDPAIRWLLVSPDLHRIHHSDRRPETDSNFATVFPIWDRLFGTYRAYALDSHPTLQIGLREFREAKYLSVHWTFAMPFLCPASSANKPARTSFPVS
jgi:sterol desaturase/sphingolipid hydroxylase (fatty acid hydroxylase superfamily)